MKARVGIVGLVVGALLLLGGCADDGSDEAEKKDGNGGKAEKAEAEDPGAGSHLEALGAQRLTFGQEATLDGGVKVLVGKPEAFEPSGTTVTGPETEHVKFTVKVVNGSKEKLRSRDISVTVESKGGQGADVVDEKQKVTGPPRKAVKPGKDAQWVQGFGVQNPDDVLVVVQAGLERAPVAFTGS